MENWKYPGKEPLVSICCATYNHEKFIRDAIEGFLMQKTNFPFEILVHDDASTDNTQDIIREYEKRYSNLIFPIYQKENQYSRGIKVSHSFQYPRARGKYIALCEGDDYWTDPYKLQKQVDFMGRNPGYSLCVGGFIRYAPNTEEKSFVIKNIKENDPNRNGFTFSLKEMQIAWLTQTLTALFRKDIIDKIDFSRYKHRRDAHLFYHLVKERKAFYFREIFGVYRIHENGIYSMKKPITRSKAEYYIHKELYVNNKDEYTRSRYFLFIIDLFQKKQTTLKEKIKLYFEALSIVKLKNEARLLVSVLIPKKIRDIVKLLLLR